MVDRCTIRAPHDGFVIYATDPGRPRRPADRAGLDGPPGAEALLPARPGKMQVTAYFHESVARQVHEGMTGPGPDRGAGEPDPGGPRRLGRPAAHNAGNWFSDEVKYFLGVVKLDSVPEGIRPGMTAEVEVDVDRRHDVLAVPPRPSPSSKAGRSATWPGSTAWSAGRSRSAGRPRPSGGHRGLAEGDQVVLRPDGSRRSTPSSSTPPGGRIPTSPARSRRAARDRPRR